MTGYRCWHDVYTISSTSRCRRCKRGITRYRYLHDVGTISSTSLCRRCKRGYDKVPMLTRYWHDIVNIAMSTISKKTLWTGHTSCQHQMHSMATDLNYSWESVKIYLSHISASVCTCHWKCTFFVLRVTQMNKSKNTKCGAHFPLVFKKWTCWIHDIYGLNLSSNSNILYTLDKLDTLPFSLKPGLTSFCGVLPMTDFNVKCFTNQTLCHLPLSPYRPSKMDYVASYPLDIP